MRTFALWILLASTASAQIIQSGGQGRSILQSGRQGSGSTTAQDAYELRPAAPPTPQTTPATEACPPEVAAIGMAMLDLQPGDLLADIGCGDGRQLIAAVREYGCRGLGIEIVPDLANAARAAVAAAGLSDRIEIITADARRVSLDGVTAVFLYHFPEQLEWIAPMVAGVRVVSAFHPLPGRSETLQVGGVYYYAAETAAQELPAMQASASSGQSATYLVLFSTATCGPCNAWKETELPKLRTSRISTTLIDINQQPEWGVTSGPEFWIVDRKTKRTIRKLRGYQSAVYLQTLIKSYDAGDTHSAEVNNRIQNGPQQRYRIFDGQPGSSHQNRQSLIQHLLNTGIHPGKQHSLAELNAMTDQQLDDLHTQDHREEGQVRVVQPATQRVAVWGGQTYTARQCNRRNCTMCNSIEAQLRGR